MLFYFACEAAGASNARHSLLPLFLEAAVGRARAFSRGESAEVCVLVRSWRILSRQKPSAFVNQTLRGRPRARGKAGFSGKTCLWLAGCFSKAKSRTRCR